MAEHKYRQPSSLKNELSRASGGCNFHARTTGHSGGACRLCARRVPPTGSVHPTMFVPLLPALLAGRVLQGWLPRQAERTGASRWLSGLKQVGSVAQAGLIAFRTVMGTRSSQCPGGAVFLFALHCLLSPLSPGVAVQASCTVPVLLMLRPLDYALSVGELGTSPLVSSGG